MRSAVLVLVGILAAMSVQAQQALTLQEPASPITDHFAIRGGYYWGHVGTLGRFDSAAGVPGTPFNLEYDFGLSPRQRQPRMELIFRLRERSRLRVDFFDLSRQATQLITRPIVYSNHTFFTNDVVHSEFDWRQMDVTYTYSFLRNDRFELGFGAGVHLIQAEAIGNVAARAVREQFSVAGPYATLALDGTWRMSERWSLSARAQYFDLRINGQEGMLGDYRGELQFRAFRNLAMGLGFEGLRVRLDIRNKNPSGLMKLNVDGTELFVRASF